MDIDTLREKNIEEKEAIMKKLREDGAKNVASTFSITVDKGNILSETVQHTSQEILAMQEILTLDAYRKDIAAHYLCGRLKNNLPSEALQKVRGQQWQYEKYGLPQEYETLTQEILLEVFENDITLHDKDVLLLEKNKSIRNINISFSDGYHSISFVDWKYIQIKSMNRRVADGWR